MDTPDNVPVRGAPDTWAWTIDGRELLFSIATNDIGTEIMIDGGFGLTFYGVSTTELQDIALRLDDEPAGGRESNTAAAIRRLRETALRLTRP
jgi:hypothetical protein